METEKRKRNIAGNAEWRRLGEVDFLVRVYNQEPRKKYVGPTGCSCAMLYPVVMASVGIEHIKQGVKVDRQKFVCGCHGELVS